MPQNFTNVVKPTHLCNLACAYCYNEDVRSPVMSIETLTRVVEQTFAYCTSLPRAPHVDFIWHGGEPMLAGRSFYETCRDVQESSHGGLTYNNTLQTNGVLIDQAWAKFLKATGFRVSLSIDGPREMHDSTRHYISGKGSFDKVMAAVECLREAGIPFGVAVVISKANAAHTEAVYDFLARERLPFNVIPLTRSGDGLANFEDLGLAPDEYAEPWIRMYDRWFDSSEATYVYASDFVFKTRAILVGSPQDCIAQANCSSAHISTDPEGDVYPCATLSGDPEWRYGSIIENSLASLMESQVSRRAQRRQEDPHCGECKWRHVCHGGCMQRAVKFYGTPNTRDYYCPSLYRIYEHIEERLRSEAGLNLSELPAISHTDGRPPPAERPLRAKTPVHKVRGQFISLKTITTNKEA